MSSPFPAVSSQNMETTDNETPGTTPPAPSSAVATPGQDVEMTDANDVDETNDDTVAEATSPGDKLLNELEEEDTALTLPISKIKKIFKMDPEYLAASQSAVYATGVATELFVQYFVEQATLSAKVDKRKKILYKDFSNAVSTQDSLLFLSDTVPKTQPIGELISQKKVNLIGDDIEVDTPEVAAESTEVETPAPVAKKAKQAPVLAKGQQTLNFQATKEVKPIKKAVIHDLMTNDDDSESKENTEEKEDVVVVEE